MPIIQTKLCRAAEEIRKLYPTLTYDHRPLLPAAETSYDVKMTEEFRISYACFKYAVAKVLQPKSICEIGVGSGIAASAFLAACPQALYVGIDNLTDEKLCQYPFTSELKKRFVDLGYNARFDIRDSMDIQVLPEPSTFDLCHVDGGHLYGNIFHDMTLALQSKSQWILVDDARDSQVSFGLWHALSRERRGSVEAEMFSDTWTGNLLYSDEPAH